MTKFLWVPSASIGLQRFNPDSPSEKTGRALLSSSPLPLSVLRHCGGKLRGIRFRNQDVASPSCFQAVFIGNALCLLLLVKDQEIYACLIQKEIYDSEIAERK
jgi:hypothetical protein